MIIKAVLSLGSNIGNRFGYITQAKNAIQLKAGEIETLSNIYETEPWGVENQENYLNQIIIINTVYYPLPLLFILQKIEKDLGRKREIHFGARTIDIDILYYGDQIIKSQYLEIPHPLIQKRRFILVPLSEILPCQIHPYLKKTNETLLEELDDDGEIIKWQPD
jgi:2-amino-4-hydroxy-6-hydroxymethyldihydropteridine diphosphokinase